MTQSRPASIEPTLVMGAGVPLGHAAGSPLGHGAGSPLGHGAGSPFAPRAVALVLHGGKAASRGQVHPNALVFLRMQPFARAIEQRADGVAVAMLRYRYRGWNEPDLHPVADVEFALRRLEQRYGQVPIILVGHSMGGRAAFRAAGAPLVRAVVGLAPWLPAGEPVEQLAGRDVAIVHGTRDHTTSAAASARFAALARPIARQVACLQVRRSGHAMIRRSELWHRLAAEFVAATAAGEKFDSVVASAHAVGCHDCRERGAPA